MTKPIIGISVNYKENTSRIADAYVGAVALAGGIPLLLPLVADEQILAEAMRHIDGLVMSGGADIDPNYFGEKPIPELGTVVPERDTYDWTLIEYARRFQTPILGICRGMQILNVHFGGTLFQDITAQCGLERPTHDQGETPRSTPTHNVKIAENSRLQKITKSETLAVNTFHHQAVKDVAPSLVCVATSDDGICEAIESRYYPILGVQWHPENLAISGRKEHLALFEWLVGEARLQREARELHNACVTLDSHCDTPMVYTEGMDFGQRNDGAQIDFVKMDEGFLDTIFMAAYIPQKELEKSAFDAAEKLAFDTLHLIHTQVAKNADKAMIATSADDIEMAKRLGKKAVVPAVENGFAIGNDLANIQKLYDLGARYITLCHNGDNQICDSAVRSENRHNGLSDFGRKVVAEMNRLGMMVDLSHAGEKSFWDALALSKTPIICSHSSARALCNHPRNLTDEQLRALAEKGGVCQVCLYDGFLSENEVEANVFVAVNHIDHIVKIAGIDHVGIGSDFDGGGGIKGCQAGNEFVNIVKELLRRGYSHSDCRKILGENLLRVMREVENQKQH